MRKIVYLFKTDGEPIHFGLKNKVTGDLSIVFIINTELPNFKVCTEPVIDEIYIDPSFQTESWFWKSYMPALHAGNSVMYNFILD